MVDEVNSTAGCGTNLTREVGPLIGREQLLASVAAAFDRGQRLVTLTGTGGAGKTHLASAFAHASLGGRCQEVWLCDLSAATDKADIVAIVKTTLGLPSSASATTNGGATWLGVALGERGPLLLVLDNFEHLTEHAAETVGRWLELAPRVTFLVTTRRRLHLPNEHVIEVGPLAEDAAIELFLQRAQAIDGGFRLDERSRAAVVTIVRRLDALPLAIEMAAPWVQTLSAEALADELAKGVDLLSQDDPCAPPRHARLDATVRWSWEQLSPLERSLLHQVATLFHGRFSLATAEVVLAWSAADAPPVAVLRGLYERSVLRVLRGDPSADAVLFANYQTVVALIGSFAGPLPEAVHQAGAERLVRLAEVEVTRLRGAGLREALRWLERHRSDLAAVLARFTGVAPALTAAAALVLQRVAAKVGPVEMALEMARRALADAKLVGDVVYEAEALRARAEIAWLGRRLADADRDLEEARLRLAGVEAPRLLGEIDLLRAQVARDAREHGRASDDGARALQAFIAAQDLHGQVLTLLVSATGPAMDAGNDEARGYLERAAEIATRTGDVLIGAHVDSALATWHANRGDRDASIAHQRRALAGFTEAGDDGQRTRVLGFLGVSLYDVGQVTEGRRCIDEALDEARRLGVVAVAATLPDPVDGGTDASMARMQAVARLVSATGDYVADGVTAGHVAALLLRRGELAAARRAYQLGLEHVLTNPDRGRAAIHFKGLGAVLDLAAGRFDEAERELVTALGWIDGWEGIAGKAAGTLLELCIDLARRRVIPAEAPNDRVVKQLQTLIGNAARLSPLVAMGVQSLRLALFATGPSVDARRRLRVGPDARWFELDDEPRVDLARSGPIRTMLLALVGDALTLAPPRSMEALFQAGWPGERVSPGSAANRVYATLARLRALGLRSVVLRQRDGWLIDRAVRVEPWD